MYGLGLGPRCLLNSLHKYIHDQIFKLSSQIITCQVSKKPNDKEHRATVEASKVKEVSGGGCWRGKWLSVLHFTGEISYHLRSYLQLSKLGIGWGSFISKYFSETWILPFAVLFAMVAYAVVAIVFYNIGG